MTCHDDGAVRPVWVLGASGRSGRGVVAALVQRGMRPVLVGRDEERLTAARDAAGAGEVLVAATVAEMAAAVVRLRPGVVANTVGPFTASAGVITRACLQVGAHYVDLANNLATTQTVLRLHEQAVAAGVTLVTGGGFGVTATESVTVRLCADRPAPVRVRVDMIPSLAVEAGRVGPALAATVLTGLPGVAGGGRFQGRRFERGSLVPAGIGGDVERLTLPGGGEVTTAGVPLGELLAAQRASGAAAVTAASSEAPTGALIRLGMPVLGALLSVRPIRAAAVHALAAVRMRARPAPREHSFGHARLDYADDTVVEGWLRVGDAQTFTNTVCAEIVARLSAGAGPGGAGTPAALFGPGLAQACGGEYLLDQQPAAGADGL